MSVLLIGIHSVAQRPKQEEAELNDLSATPRQVIVLDFTDDSDDEDEVQGLVLGDDDD